MATGQIKERPILMHARSIKGVLAGTKTQTRRVVKPPRGWADKYPYIDRSVMKESWQTWWWNGVHEHVGVAQDCPYGQPGDRLWVREGWQAFDRERQRFAGTTAIASAQMHVYATTVERGMCDIEYRADSDPKRDFGDWRPSIHMPRWASRITLEITDVRVERVQEINYPDMRAEGALPAAICGGEQAVLQRDYFQPLWDDTNGKGAWGRNDWVWVVGFKVLERSTRTLDGIVAAGTGE